MSLTCTQDMLITASRSTRLLDDDACNKITDFLRKQQNNDGGFAGRTSASDLYYTLFAMASLFALKETVKSEPIQQYINSFEPSLETLDFVHLASLARCQASLPYIKQIPKFITIADSPLSFFAKFAPSLMKKDAHLRSKNNKLVDLINKYEATDGSYHHHLKNQQTGSIYAIFLAYLAFQDLGIPMRNSRQLIDFICSMKCKDGSFANEASIKSGSTTTTAAAIVILQELGQSIPTDSIASLVSRQHPDGGFLASANTPAPDLLSSATALYALKRIDFRLDSLREANLSFIGSLWNEDGGFSGNPFDDKSDCEYTFYALLAMGSLG